jgi:CBS domain containing-hemolysin-like protein
MVVVMDEHGGTAGILTMEDICAEAVGDIEEGTEDVPDVLPVGTAGYQVQGTVRLDTLGDLIGRDLEHPEIDTVSGLILSELGRPPVLGDSIQWNGLLFEVSGLYGRGVRQVTLTIETPEATADGDAERHDAH